MPLSVCSKSEDRPWAFRTVAGSTGPSMVICENSELNTTAGHCTLYAFDPQRSVILLIGGDKTGDDRWYDKHVPIADRLYDEHMEQLRKGGLIDG